MNFRNVLISITVLCLSLSAANAISVSTFNNTAAITIPTLGNAALYPSNIVVNGVPTNFTRMVVTLNGFLHTFTDDVDIIVVSPGGQRAILMSDAGGIRPGVVNQTFTFAQTAPGPIPDATAPSTGTFRPINY